jgi:hypothetical protein
MITEQLKPATMTLVLTPHMVRNFGGGLWHSRERQHAAWTSAADLYGETLQTSFGLITRSKSVREYRARWNRAVVRYSQAYDQILKGFIQVLGSSTFELAYLKAIAEVQGEFDGISFAIQDLRELNRLHIAYSVNIASSYEALVQSSAPEFLERLNELLRSSNFGLTLLFLLLSGHISGPSWILLATHRHTQESLAKIEQSFKVPIADKVGGSLKIRDGNLGFLDDITRK